jgi:hypothetical protein
MDPTAVADSTAFFGFGQGADVAVLLPLLDWHCDGDDDDGDDDGDDNEDDDEDDEEKENRCRPIMFQGLRFVVLIDGKDILRIENNECNGNDDNATNDDDDVDGGKWEAVAATMMDDDNNDRVYAGLNGVQSLHTILDGGRDDDNDDGNDNGIGRMTRRGGGGNKCGGKQLAKM